MESGRVTPSRVTRSQHKHLQSESDSSSRPTTPLSTVSLETSPKEAGLRRMTRRLSISTPSKLTGKSVKESTPEICTPSRRITRRNSTSNIEIEVQKSVKTPKFPTLTEEDVGSEKPKNEEGTRRKSISPKLRSQTVKISAATSRTTRSALKIEAESKIKTRTPKKRESPSLRTKKVNDCDSEVEIINIITDEDSSHSSVTEVKTDEKVKNNTKGKMQKRIDEETDESNEDSQEDTIKHDVDKNNEEVTNQSVEKTVVNTTDGNNIPDIEKKDSIEEEEAKLEQPIPNKVYEEEDTDTTDDDEESFNTEKNKTLSNVNANEIKKEKTEFISNGKDIEMMEIDNEIEEVIDFRESQKDEDVIKHNSNIDKDININNKTVQEHIEITKVTETNNEVITENNAEHKDKETICNSNENIDSNAEINKSLPQALNKSFNELNVNRSLNNKIENITNNVVIKDVSIDENLSNSKVLNEVSNSNLKENKNILEVSNSEVPNAKPKENKSILEENNIEVSNAVFKENKTSLETTNTEVPNANLKGNKSISKGNDSENNINIRNVSVKSKDLPKSLNSSKNNVFSTLQPEQRSQPTTPINTIRKLKVMMTEVRTLEKTTPNRKVKETLTDKSLTLETETKEPTTPEQKIGIALVEKNLSLNKNPNGHRNSVTFDNSDDNDVEKKIYPKTPSLLKSKSYIEVDSSKDDSQEKRQESFEQLPLLEVTPLKSNKLLDKLQSSTPIVDCTSKVIVEELELKESNLKAKTKIEKSITLNSTADNSAVSIEELNKEKISPKKTTLSASTDSKVDSSKSINTFAQSWTQCVKVKAGNNSKIDTISESETLDNKQDVEIENISPNKSSSKLNLQFVSDEESNEASSEESNEEFNEETDDGHIKNQFVDDEAMDAGEDYRSGDSMDEEERREMEENEIIPDGESIGSYDTEEDDNDSDNEEKLSFIATSEDEVQNVDDDDDDSDDSADSEDDVVLQISDEKLTDDVVQIKQTYKRKRVIESSSDSENETENKFSSTINKSDIKNKKHKQNNLSTKSSNSDNLSDSALNLHLEPETDTNLDKKAIKELNESRKKILKDMNRSERFNKSFLDSEALESSSDAIDDMNKSSTSSVAQTEKEVADLQSANKQSQTGTDVDSVNVQNSLPGTNDQIVTPYDDKDKDSKNEKSRENNLNNSKKSLCQNKKHVAEENVNNNNNVEIQIKKVQESMDVDEDSVLNTNDKASDMKTSQNTTTNSHKEDKEISEKNLSDNDEMKNKNKKRKSSIKNDNVFENNQSFNSKDDESSKNNPSIHKEHKEKINNNVENVEDYARVTLNESVSGKESNKNNKDILHSTSYDEELQVKLKKRRKSISSRELLKKYENSSSSDTEVAEIKSNKLSNKKMKKKSENVTLNSDDEAEYKSQTLRKSLNNKEMYNNNEEINISMDQAESERQTPTSRNSISYKEKNNKNEFVSQSSDEEEVEHKQRSFRKSTSYKERKSRVEKNCTSSDDFTSTKEEQIEYKIKSLRKSISKQKENHVSEDETEASSQLKPRDIEENDFNTSSRRFSISTEVTKKRNKSICSNNTDEDNEKQIEYKLQSLRKYSFNETHNRNEADPKFSDEEQTEYKSNSLRKSMSKLEQNDVYEDEDATEASSQLLKKLKSKTSMNSKNEEYELFLVSDIEENELKSASRRNSMSTTENKKNNESICTYNAEVEDEYQKCSLRKSLSKKENKMKKYLSSSIDKETECKTESPRKSKSRTDIKENISTFSDDAEVGTKSHRAYNNEAVKGGSEDGDSSLNEKKFTKRKSDSQKKSLHSKQSEEKIEHESKIVSPSKRKSIHQTENNINNNNLSCNTENLNHSKRKSVSFEESKLKSPDKNKSRRNSLLKKHENVESEELTAQSNAESDFVESEITNNNETSAEVYKKHNLLKNLSYENIKKFNAQNEADSNGDDKTVETNQFVNKLFKKKYRSDKHKEVLTSSSESENNVPKPEVLHQSHKLNSKHTFNIQSTLFNSKKRNFASGLGDSSTSSAEDEMEFKTTTKVRSRLCRSFVDCNKKSNKKYNEKLHTSCTVNTFELEVPQNQYHGSAYKQIERDINTSMEVLEPNSDEFHSAEENIFDDFVDTNKIHFDSRRQTLAPTGLSIPDQFLDAAESFVENPLENENSKSIQKDRSCKRKRLTQSFCSAGSLDTTDFELRHINKKPKVLDKIDAEVVKREQIIEDAAVANLEDVLESKKKKIKSSPEKHAHVYQEKSANLSHGKHANTEVSEKAATDDVSIPVHSKKESKRKEKAKLALEQALKASADIITKMPKKKKKEQKLMIENKLESEHVQNYGQEESIFTKESSPKTVSMFKDAAQSMYESHKLKSAAGEVIETPITPKKNKKMRFTKFNLPTGTVCVEPMTPSSKTLVNGFRESPISPLNIGFKVQNSCQDGSPITSRKNRKRKRYIEEPKHSLPKPKWTQSGSFIEEEMSRGEIATLKTKKVDSLQLSKESALNFKNNALFRKNIQRESSQTLLRRKERRFLNK